MDLSTPSIRAVRRRGDGAYAEPFVPRAARAHGAPIERVFNPIRVQDPELGLAFEQAVEDSLRGERLDRVQVRFGIWRGETARPQFVCKVEYPGTTLEGGGAPWRWWSPIVETPSELATAVREALGARRRRLELAHDE